MTDLAVPTSSAEVRVLVKGERKLSWGQRKERRRTRSRGVVDRPGMISVFFFLIECEIKSRDGTLERSDSPPHAENRPLSQQ